MDLSLDSESTQAIDGVHAADGAQATDGQISIRMEISREMVRLYKEQFGRGPTKARTEFAGPDIVVCTLEDSFTPVERRLAEMQEHQRLRDTRLYFQHATKDKFIESVERILGRKVRAFNSSIDTENDVSIEIFHLEPDTSQASRPGSTPPVGEQGVAS